MKEDIRVLMVEDDEDDYILVRDMLAEGGDDRYQIDWVNNYDKGLEAIGRREHNLYLIDYRLGVDSGLDLLRAAIRLRCRAPVVVMTGQGDRSLDFEAMRSGAADFIEKGNFDGLMLERSLRYAINRYSYQHEQESRLYERFVELVASETMDSSAGKRLLCEEVPELYDEMKQRYDAVLDFALREDDVAQKEVSNRLLAFAEHLGFLGANAVDLLNINAEVVAARVSSVDPNKCKHDKSREPLLMLELMGYLVSYYRERVLHIGDPHSASAPGASQ